MRVYLNVDPTFDIVRDHPRFAALIEDLNLPQYGPWQQRLLTHVREESESDMMLVENFR